MDQVLSEDFTAQEDIGQSIRPDGFKPRDGGLGIILRTCRKDPALFTVAENTRNAIYVMESMQRKYREHMRDSYGPGWEDCYHGCWMTVIMDRHHTTKANVRTDDTKELAPIISANYPETVLQVVVTPTTWWMWPLWSIIKLFIDPVTREKVSLLNDEEALEELPSKFRREILEERFGGLAAPYYPPHTEGNILKKK